MQATGLPTYLQGVCAVLIQGRFREYKLKSMKLKNAYYYRNSLVLGYLVIAVIFFSPKVIAQNEPPTPLFETIIIDTTDLPPGYYINYTGLGIIQMRDRFLSPIQYSGIAFTTDFNALTYRSNRVSLFTTEFDAGFSTNNVNSSFIATLNARLTYGELFQLTQKTHPDTRFYAGPDLGFHLLLNIHQGNQNNLLSYAGVLPLGANALFEHRFNMLNRPFMLSNHLSFPLVSLLTRNPYAYPAPDVSEGGYSFREVVQLGTWNRYLNFQNRIALDFYTNKRRKGKVVAQQPLRVAYLWSFIQMNHPNELQIAGHSISVSTIIRQKF